MRLSAEKGRHGHQLSILSASAHRADKTEPRTGVLFLFIVCLWSLSVVPELFQNVFRQELQDHSRCELSLLLFTLIVGGRVVDIGVVEAKLSDVLQADILLIEEGRQLVICCAPEVESDIAVEEADGDFVELLADEAGVLEVGGSYHLHRVSLLLECVPISRLSQARDAPAR